MKIARGKQSSAHTTRGTKTSQLITLIEPLGPPGHFWTLTGSINPAVDMVNRLDPLCRLLTCLFHAACRPRAIPQSPAQRVRWEGTFLQTTPREPLYSLFFPPLATLIASQCSPIKQLGIACFAWTRRHGAEVHGGFLSRKYVFCLYYIQSS